MYVIKALAAVLVLVVARTLSGEYKKFTESKLRLYDGFVSLLSFIKTELECRSRSVREWAAEFSDEALDGCGFLESLKNDGNLSSAFSAAKKGCSALGEEATKLLCAYFSSFGKSYRAAEEEQTRKTHDELSRILAHERSDSQRSVRAVRVLTYAVAIGVILLFL